MSESFDVDGVDVPFTVDVISELARLSQEYGVTIRISITPSVDEDAGDAKDSTRD